MLSTETLPLPHHCIVSQRCPCPRTPRYLGQPGLLGPLELEDTAGLQEGDKGQALSLVDGRELLPPAHLAVGVVELGRAGRGYTTANPPRDTPGTPTTARCSLQRVPRALTFPRVTSRAWECRASRSREQSSTFCCRGKVSWAPRDSPARRSPNTSESTREMCRSPTRLGTGDTGESPVGQTEHPREVRTGGEVSHKGSPGSH